MQCSIPYGTLDVQIYKRITQFVGDAREEPGNKILLKKDFKWPASKSFNIQALINGKWQKITEAS